MSHSYFLDLDSLDRHILFEYDSNSRRSLSQIAKSLRISRERLEYRTKRLIESGVILNFSAAINPSRLGYQIYKVFLRVKQRKSRADQLLRFLKSHPRSSWVAKSEGSWDIIFCLYAFNESEFHRMHLKIFSQFNDIVMSFNSCLMTTIKMYQRSYFSPKKKKGFFPLVGEEKKVILDETSKKLINHLTNDAWISNQDLADKCGTSTKVIASRIEELEATNVITGYRVSLSMTKLGLLFFKTRIFLESYDEQLRARFEAYCDKHPNITCYSEQIGDCNLEIELHVPSYEDYFQIIEDIRSRFDDLIRNYDSLVLGKGTYHWIPRD